MGKKTRLTIYAGLVVMALLLNAAGVSAQGGMVLVLEIEGPVTPRRASARPVPWAAEEKTWERLLRKRKRRS